MESKYRESTNVLNYDVPSQPSVRVTITIRGSSRQSVKHTWALNLDATAILCLRVLVFHITLMLKVLIVVEIMLE